MQPSPGGWALRRDLARRGRARRPFGRDGDPLPAPRRRAIALAPRRRRRDLAVPRRRTPAPADRRHGARARHRSRRRRTSAGGGARRRVAGGRDHGRVDARQLHRVARLRVRRVRAGPGGVESGLTARDGGAVAVPCGHARRTLEGTARRRRGRHRRHHRPHRVRGDRRRRPPRALRHVAGDHRAGRRRRAAHHRDVRPGLRQQRPARPRTADPERLRRTDRRGGLVARCARRPRCRRPR